MEAMKTCFCYLILPQRASEEETVDIGGRWKFSDKCFLSFISSVCQEFRSGARGVDTAYTGIKESSVVIS